MSLPTSPVDKDLPKGPNFLAIVIGFAVSIVILLILAWIFIGHSGKKVLPMNTHSTPSQTRMSPMPVPQGNRSGIAQQGSPKREPRAMTTHLVSLILLGVLNSGQMAFHASEAKRADRLVWSEEFKRGSTPDVTNWSYQTGGGGWGNHELETYCAPSSAVPPCNPKQRNLFLGPDAAGNGDYLHVVARRDAAGEVTSGRIASEGLRSFQYGRIEARIKIPAGQGVWPAFWMLGANIKERPWPASGEIDIMENIGREPDTIHGSIHGTGFTGTPITRTAALGDRSRFADAFHVYGMVWEAGKISFYVDDADQPYATLTRADLPAGAVWPFDDGRYFLLLNLAIGGTWPGDPDSATTFPAEMLVDWIRVYQKK